MAEKSFFETYIFEPHPRELAGLRSWMIRNRAGLVCSPYQTACPLFIGACREATEQADQPRR